ncbi:hypothetical protein BU17DRAFT_63572 [Hysterangium stoloniferum]|nr:hypothetical protein BU17DRAFT_63572 [Hysterangium stoloniferum]
MTPGRSTTGNHILLPSNNKDGAIQLPDNLMPDRSLAKLSGGTVIWRIWPAVLLHTIFAAAIVVLTQETQIKLAIPNIMLTLLGVVIGFVISLRVSSGYWWGRCAWSDIVKTSRTMSRLVWIHVPPKINKPIDANDETPRDEIGQAMREKRIALELIEAFAISVKHYVRGELGIYYEDLYPVVRPFHEHHAHSHHAAETQPHPPPVAHNVNMRIPKRQHSIESYSQLMSGQLEAKRSQNSLIGSNTPTSQASGSKLPTTSRKSSTLAPPSEEPLIVPPITGYGSVNKTLRHSSSRTSLGSSHSSEGEHDPLLPSLLPGHKSGASTDLIPFLATLSSIGRAINPYYWYRAWRAHWREGFEGNDETGGVNIRWAEEGQSRKHRRAARQTYQGTGKHRPRVAGDGENLPLEILRCMSEWLSLLEARGVLGGNALSGMYGCVASYEDILGIRETRRQIQSHTVWLYLFFLPFQLAHDFNWYTIPGTAVAAFFYLGFIAAGDEIEQPFDNKPNLSRWSRYVGYDDNDLDLDLFCRQVIQADLHTLILTPFPNAPMGSHLELNINEASTVADVSLGKHHDHY